MNYLQRNRVPMNRDLNVLGIVMKEQQPAMEMPTRKTADIPLTYCFNGLNSVLSLRTLMYEVYPPRAGCTIESRMIHEAVKFRKLPDP